MSDIASELRDRMHAVEARVTVLEQRSQRHDTLILEAQREQRQGQKDILAKLAELTELLRAKAVP